MTPQKKQTLKTLGFPPLLCAFFIISLSPTLNEVWTWGLRAGRTILVLADSSFTQSFYIYSIQQFNQ